MVTRAQTSPIAQTARPVRKRSGGFGWVHLFLILASLLTIAPVIYMVLASLQPGGSIFLGQLIPSSLSFSHYDRLLYHSEFPRWMLNTIIVGISVGVINLLVTASSAYAFSRLKFWGSAWGLQAVFIAQLFPAGMSIVAIYYLLIKTNLEGTLIGLILVYSGTSAFTIWMLKAFIDGIPKEIDEAAKVDGANNWVIFWRIILPLSTPMLAVLFIWSLMGSWNEFMLASIVLQKPSTYTLAVGLHVLSNGQGGGYTDWGLFAAGATLASIPLLIIYLALQKQLLQGMAMGGVKA
jgi:arabinogalactan oligomer/maltooligosaccharide transport system permease protein